MRYDECKVWTGAILAMTIAVAAIAPLRAAATPPVVALCPDIGESVAVFVSREPGRGLAQRLEREGFDVVLVDPWVSREAVHTGFDAVVEQVYPYLVDVAAEDDRGVVWLGHGLCGLLPAAAEARGDAPALAGWIALGTRFDYRFVAPAVTDWLASWEDATPPSEEIEQRASLTGPLAPVAVQLYRDVVQRTPPAAVVADYSRWCREGAPTAADGSDHLAALDTMRTPALLVAGVSDPFAPPEDVLPAVERLGASYRMLSRVNGHGEEFGHAGMLVSGRARRGVDRVVVAWLRGRGRLP